MKYPDNLRYTKTHEWVLLEDDGIVTVGISDYAQDALGDVVFVELPEVGEQVDAGEGVAAVESVKTASDIYAPVSGEIVEVNTDLTDQPELLNTEPYGGGWIFRIRPDNPADVEKLLEASAYREFAESQ
ncbi:glycine cleavage system protein GcvH [Calidithermus roseus]|jgi:glycine cleavage system H protein|uniref:Glycine cleavage system H protein n=1 Tax=Calidithermus roseus TaxID=1644118 RepID=A0A399EHT9_9DEIN|nr:glycine cleavage system protein GcvH [Calidithermus roseus]RIH83518.1 Glycine cleavage system H protein [Calidithermus roseus]